MSKLKSQSRKLFGTAGIRGSIREKVTERLALEIGRAMSTMLANEGQVLVGSDYRTTSAELRATLMGGLLGGGIDVLDAGFLPTPTLAFGVRELGAQAGVMITASHNPPQDNGMKCYTHDGRGFRDVTWDQVGALSNAPDITDMYSADLLARMRPFRRKLRVVVDCANGTAYNLTPLILSQMGCEVISLNGHPDGRFPGRPAEPSPQNLVMTCELVLKAKADLGIAHDGDGDRLSVIDEKGRYVNNDTLLAFFARLSLKQHGPGRIVTTVDTSSRIDEIAISSGGTVERTRLGKTHVQLTEENRANVRLCCEPWKIIDPEWGFWGDAVYSACRLVQALDQSKGPASALFRGIPNYPQERFHFQCPDRSKDAAMKKISHVLEHEKGTKSLTTLDGIRVDFNDNSWVLIRKSGTEPKIRVYCEGRSAKRLHQLVSKSANTVRRAIKTANAA